MSEPWNLNMSWSTTPDLVRTCAAVSSRPLLLLPPDPWDDEPTPVYDQLVAERAQDGVNALFDRLAALGSYGLRGDGTWWHE